MKKLLYISSILFISFLLPNLAFAQELEPTEAEETSSLRDRIAARQQEKKKEQEGNIARLSVRAEMMNNLQTTDFSNASWMREVYRILDVEKGANGALSNPVTPINGRMSLFSMIFKLMAQNNIEAYDYTLDGNEVFTDQYKVDFGEILKTLEVPYEKIDGQYSFNEMDIPTNEIFGFYIKEAWYFDKTNSMLGKEVTAICPILDRAMVSDIDIDYNRLPTSRVPLFWIPYENLRPYAARMPIMASNYNNVINKTIDDYFALGLYEGEIYKTTNVENKILMQLYETDEEIEQAQKRIESELKGFEENLWVANDSTYQESNNKKKRKNQRKAKLQSSQGKAKSTSNTATFSARDRR